MQLRNKCRRKKQESISSAGDYKVKTFILLSFTLSKIYTPSLLHFLTFSLVLECNLALLTVEPGVAETTRPVQILEAPSVVIAVISLQKQTGTFDRHHVISGVDDHH